MDASRHFIEQSMVSIANHLHLINKKVPINPSHWLIFLERITKFIKYEAQMIYQGIHLVLVVLDENRVVF